MYGRGAWNESEEVHCSSPGTSGTPGVSEPPRWVFASGRRVALFSFPRKIFRSLGHRREVRTWDFVTIPDSTGRQHSKPEHVAGMQDGELHEGRAVSPCLSEF